MSGSKILEGLKDAVAGNFASVTIEGQRWVRDPAPSALTHLGNALYFGAAIHPDDRNQAFENALAFYNAACPEKQVDGNEHATLRTVYPSAASTVEADLRETLQNIRAAIMEADPAVLCDTLWMPQRISPAETAVDHIDLALARNDRVTSQPITASEPSPAASVPSQRPRE